MKKFLKRGGTLLFILVIQLFFTEAKCQGFDKATYYKVLANGNAETIDKQVKIINATPNINKEAYTGALLMKKAGIVKGPAKKLNNFKEGHNQLEAAIEKDNQNAEWHFLRLIIQEHAPKIVNYRSD